MEHSTQNLIEVSALVTAILGGVLRLLEKFVLPVITEALTGKKSRTEVIGDRVLKIETNHLVHIEQDIREIKNEQVEQGNRITRIETLLEK